MAEIGDRISRAIGMKVRYVNVAPAERRHPLLDAGTSAYMADALDEQADERRGCPESKIDLTAHELFGVRPPTFDDGVA
jgi:hypothetical protein